MVGISPWTWAQVRMNPDTPCVDAPAIDSSVWKWTDATWLELVTGWGVPVSLSSPQYMANSLEPPNSNEPS